MNSIVRILLISALCWGCGGNNDLEIPADIIPKDSMVSALLDIHIVEGAKVGQKIMGDTLKVSDYYEKVYAKYGVTEEGFQKSFQFYSDHPDVMNELYKQVIERLNKIQQEPPRTPLTDEPEQPSRTTFDKPLEDVLEEPVNDTVDYQG